MFAILQLLVNRGDTTIWSLELRLEIGMRFIIAVTLPLSNGSVTSVNAFGLHVHSLKICLTCLTFFLMRRVYGSAFLT